MESVGAYLCVLLGPARASALHLSSQYDTVGYDRAVGRLEGAAPMHLPMQVRVLLYMRGHPPPGCDVRCYVAALL